MSVEEGETIPPIWACLPSYLQTDKLVDIQRLCVAKQIRFVDPEFKPGLASLYNNPLSVPADYSGWRNFEWARAVDVLGEGEFSLFNDVRPESVRQGYLTNSYFLSAVSALAERPALLRRLFQGERSSEEGVYAVWLNICGVWREIIVDDFLPISCINNTCEFAFSRTEEDEVWLMILEKAYAKAYGAYEKIASGNLAYTLRDLTGAPYETIEGLQSDTESVWRDIAYSCDNGFVVIAHKAS